jgi:hypothetical protein
VLCYWLTRCIYRNKYATLSTNRRFLGDATFWTMWTISAAPHWQHPTGRWLWKVIWWHLSIILAKQLLEHCLWNFTTYRISQNTYLRKTTQQTHGVTRNGVLRTDSYACSEQLYTLRCSLEHASIPSDKTTWHKVSVHRQNEGYLLQVHQATQPVQLLDYPCTSEVNWVLFSARTDIILHFIQAGYGTLPAFYPIDTETFFSKGKAGTV